MTTAQLPDIDRLETQEWIESLRQVAELGGRERAPDLDGRVRPRLADER